MALMERMEWAFRPHTDRLECRVLPAWPPQLFIHWRFLANYNVGAKDLLKPDATRWTRLRLFRRPYRCPM